MDWNLVFGQLGWSGILAGALMYIFKLYVKAQDTQIALLQDAIRTLEKRADRCESDRTALHADNIALHVRLEELLLKGLTD
jgi:hypothetical protein